MDYTRLLDALNQASLFELYRLNAAINNQLEDPLRLRAVKQALHLGQELRWFNHEENRLVEARLLEINRTRAVVQNSVDGKRWTIPFYLINLDGQAVDIAPGARRALDRNRLKVGDRVAFKDRQGQERFGQVLKLNPKSVAVQVGETRWRVAYSLLAPVIDGDLGTDDRALPGTWARIPASIEEAACDEEECAEEKPLPGSRG